MNVLQLDCNFTAHWILSNKIVDNINSGRPSLLSSCEFSRYGQKPWIKTAQMCKFTLNLHTYLLKKMRKEKENCCLLTSSFNVWIKNMKFVLYTWRNTLYCDMVWYLCNVQQMEWKVFEFLWENKCVKCKCVERKHLRKALAENYAFLDPKRKFALS